MKNNIEEDIKQVYEEYKTKVSDLIKEIEKKVPIKNYSFWYVYIDIEELFTENNTWLPFEGEFLWIIHILWNINDKIWHWLYWKSEDIKEHILKITDEYNKIATNKEEKFLEIKKKYWKEKYLEIQHAILFHNV